MRWTRAVTAVAMLSVVFVCLPASGSGQSVDEVYQQGLARERGAGDLQGAIELYSRVAASSDRVLAARALVRLGEAYEKLGAREAQGAYERVVRDYADQPEPVRIARARLAELRGGATVAARRAPVQNMVFADLPAFRIRDHAQFDFSPAGDQIVIRNPVSRDPLLGAALEIVNSGGTIVRTLLPAEKEMGRSMPRWSPDGRYVAYVQRSFVGADTSFAALMVVPAEGGSPRVVTSSIPIPNPTRGGIFWTPDSRGITVGTARGLLTVDLQGNVIHTTPMELRYLQHVTGYSPDGRWIAFDRTNDDSEQHEEVDVWIMPASGGSRVQLTDAPGFDAWPTWGPDSRSIFFVSDRGGSQNIWKLEIDPATGSARGEPTQVTSYTDASILYPRVVDGGRRLAFTLMREMSAIRIGTAELTQEPRAIARGVHPQISPDGRTIYYVSQGDPQPGIFAVAASGGTPRRLATGKPGGAYFQPFSLSRDGSAIAYFARDGRQSVLYTVATSGGAPAELLRLDSKEHLVPTWSPDGRRIAYANGAALYVVPASGGRAEKLATVKKWEGWSVRWSPDGELIAALGWPVEGAADENVVFVVPAKGGELRRLTSPEEPGYKEGLEWHPDGRRLTYMYYGHDWRGDESRVAYVDGRPTSKLVDQPYPIWDYVGKWHPDGRRYFLVSSVKGEWGLYVHDSATSSTRAVWPEANGSAGLPSFTSDGATMTFPVLRTTRQLWTIEIMP